MDAADGVGIALARDTSSPSSTTSTSSSVEPGSEEHRRVAKMMRVAVGHPAALYVASLSTPVSRRTLVDALRRGSGFFGKTPASLNWTSVRFVHMLSLRAHLLETVAPSTGNRVLSAFRGVIRFAARLGLVSHLEAIQACDVDSIRGHREPRGRALELGELAAMVAVCKTRGLVGLRDRALLGVLVGGGLRRAEGIALNVGSLTTELELRILGKGNKERVVPMPQTVCNAIEAWERALIRPPGAPLFVRFCKGVPTSSRLTPKGLYVIVRQLGERARLEHFSPHDLRRTYIGELFDAGADIKTIQDLVGHSSPITTARYDRRPGRTRRAAVDKLKLSF